MTEQWPRFRCRMTKVLDNYFFEEMKGEELASHLQRVIEVNTEIKTMEDLEHHMSKEQN